MAGDSLVTQLNRRTFKPHLRNGDAVIIKYEYNWLMFCKTVKVNRYFLNVDIASFRMKNNHLRIYGQFTCRLKVHRPTVHTS